MISSSDLLTSAIIGVLVFLVACALIAREKL